MIFTKANDEKRDILRVVSVVDIRFSLTDAKEWIYK